MDEPNPTRVTRLVALATSGDLSAAERLYAEVYEQLRGLARSYFRPQPRGHTLQPTALVHEAFVRLFEAGSLPWKDRAHLLATAARAMRQVLVDHARRRGRSKRGGRWVRVTLDESIAPAGPPDPDLLDLEAALGRLAALDPRQERIVEMRFFGGLTVEEVAAAMDLSKSTVEAEWRVARAWLARELERGSAP